MKLKVLNGSEYYYSQTLELIEQLENLKLDLFKVAEKQRKYAAELEELLDESPQPSRS